MVLTINNALVPSRAGPGYTIDLHTTLAVVATDIFRVQVNPAVGNFICSGATLQHFGGSAAVLLGPTVAPFFTFGVLDQYVAPAAAVSLQCDVCHANGTSFDTLLSAAWTWDPTGGLYILAQLAAAASSSLGILQTTYKNAP